MDAIATPEIMEMQNFGTGFNSIRKSSTKPLPVKKCTSSKKRSPGKFITKVCILKMNPIPGFYRNH